MGSSPRPRPRRRVCRSRTRRNSTPSATRSRPPSLLPILTATTYRDRVLYIFNSVAQWIAYQTSNLGVAGSSPVGVDRGGVCGRMLWPSGLNPAWVTRGAGFRHQSSGVGSNPTNITRRLPLRPIGATVARQIPVLKVTCSNHVSVIHERVSTVRPLAGQEIDEAAQGAQGVRQEG